MIGETSIVPPVAAFVAAGFEHCVANMYFIPMGLFLKEDSAWLEERDNLPDFANLTWPDFLIGNLVPVTIGNLIGGTLMVAASTGSSTSVPPEQVELARSHAFGRTITRAQRE